MKEFFANLNWIAVLFAILSFLLVYGLVPQLHKVPELTKKFFEWVYAKAGEAKNRLVAGLLQRLSIVVREVVLRLENTAIEELKDAARDGKITKEEMLVILNKVREDAIEMVKEQTKLEGIFDLLVTLVFGDETKLGQWIAGHVETQVSLLPPSNLQTGPNPAAANLKANKCACGNKENCSNCPTKEVEAPVVPPTAAASNE